MTQSTLMKVKPDRAPAFLSGEITHNRAGIAFEKTEYTSYASALAFMKAFAARPGITECIAVRNHARTLAEHGVNRWYVRFIRSSAEAPALRTAQDNSALRAACEADEYEVIANPDRPGWFHLVHRYPRVEDRLGLYECHVTLGCTCKDWTLNKRRQGTCKHMLHLRVHLHWTPAPVALVARMSDEKRAKLIRDREIDF